MLEAAEHDRIDIVPSFTGALIDDWCGEKDDARIEMSFWRFSELMKFWYRPCMDPTWNEEELNVLSENTIHFKEMERATFALYQPFQMGISKWYALDNLVQHLRELGWIEYMHGGLHDRSHKILKEDQNRTSKSITAAMQERMRRKEQTELNYGKLTALWQTMWGQTRAVRGPLRMIVHISCREVGQRR